MWIIPNNSICRKEHQLLVSLLDELAKVCPDLEFIPIDDLETELGVEINGNGRKIAEVYCAENDSGLIEGYYQLHSIHDWQVAEILDINQTVQKIVTCTHEFNT